MKKNREQFSVFRDADGQFHYAQNAEGTLEEVKLCVRRPSHLDKQKADSEYHKYFNELIKDKIMPQRKLDEVLKQTGVWDESKEERERSLVKAISTAREKLKKGGIKLSEALKIAKQSIKDNFHYIELNMERNQYLNNSAESLANQRRFDYLVSTCTVYNNEAEQKFFKDYEDYLKEDNAGNPVPTIAGTYFNRLVNNFSDDFRKDWPEYKFLMKHKFVNDKLEFIDKDGNVVDETGAKVETQETSPSTDETTAEFLPD